VSWAKERERGTRAHASEQCYHTYSYLSSLHGATVALLLMSTHAGTPATYPARACACVRASVRTYAFGYRFYDAGKLMLFKDGGRDTSIFLKFGLALGVDISAAMWAYPIDTVRRRGAYCIWTVLGKYFDTVSGALGRGPMVLWLLDVGFLKKPFFTVLRLTVCLCSCALLVSDVVRRCAGG